VIGTWEYQLTTSVKMVVDTFSVTSKTSAKMRLRRIECESTAPTQSQ
jgi:hypothetical protein